MLLSIVLIGLVVFIKVNFKEDKVVTISINSSYVEIVELAKKIIDENELSEYRINYSTDIVEYKKYKNRY